MRGRGINFDTGFLSAGTSTREPFEEEDVKREMRIIRDDLHCNAVRITGGNPDRLEVTATHAAAAGLEVWFCPFINGLTQDELLALLVDCAERAERLRRSGAEVVFVTGSELSLFTKGFFPGDTLEERLALIADPLRVRQVIPQMRVRFSEFLRRTVSEVRARFGGKLSYASLPHEGVDWTLFDIIATDAGYRTKETAPRFRDSIRAFVALGQSARQAGRHHRVRLPGLSRRRRGRRQRAIDDRMGKRPARSTEGRLRARRGRAGGVYPRAAGGLRGRRSRQRVRVHLRALRSALQRQSRRGFRSGESRHRQGAGREPPFRRPTLPRHAMATRNAPSTQSPIIGTFDNIYLRTETGFQNDCHD